MRIPVQLELDFASEEAESEVKAGVPIDSFFPEEEANRLAGVESFNKHLYRPSTYLHKWWARRSGTTFRHILKQLVPNPLKRGFYDAGGLEGKVILDPMMGGGTTLHEAIRLGANVIGVDIDPIPVLQTRAGLTLGSPAHKGNVFAKFMLALRNSVGRYYLTTCPICEQQAELQFTLYGLRKRCSCREAVFVDQFLIRSEKTKDVCICPSCWEVYKGTSHTCAGGATKELLAKGTRECEYCGEPFADLLEEPFIDRYLPLVIVGVCPDHGRFFKSPNEMDLSLMVEARSQAKKVHFGNHERFRILPGPKSRDLLRRGVSSFTELFSARQLLWLYHAQRLLSPLAREDRLWLGLLISTSLEFNSLLCGYKGCDLRRPGAIRHVFSHHAYSFPFTALENNPVFSGSATGTLNRLFHDRILRAAKWAARPVEVHFENGRRTKVPIPGEIDAGESVGNWEEIPGGKRKFLVLQGDSASLETPKEVADFIVTDPPYFNSVQYSDLSRFFRVWLSVLLPDEAAWGYDPLASAVSEGDPSGKRKYREILGDIWKMCFRALKKPEGRLLFTFHHWDHQAWSELTISLKSAGFVLVNRYVVFSENPISVHIRDLNALKHDVILVLSPARSDRDWTKWPSPGPIKTTDSYSFCKDCGTALGWFLGTELNDDQIRAEWKGLLQRGNNGKTSR